MGKKVAIYETDVQYDFSYRTGALFVHGFDDWQCGPYGAEAALPNIFEMHKAAKQKGWLVLGSVDRHFYDDAELIRNKGGVFIDHCMNGTKGQLRLAELDPQEDMYVGDKDGPFSSRQVEYTGEDLFHLDERAQIIFEKQTYSVGGNSNFEPFMKTFFEKGLETIFFNGFATDYCVYAAVLATSRIAKNNNYDINIFVVEDAIKEVGIDFDGKKDPLFAERQIEFMKLHGAIFVKTKDVLNFKN